MLFAWTSRNFIGAWPAAVAAARQEAGFYNVLPLVFVVSWNEHLEGSAIEWTYEHAYGYLMAAVSAFRG